MDYEMETAVWQRVLGHAPGEAEMPAGEALLEIIALLRPLPAWLARAARRRNDRRFLPAARRISRSLGLLEGVYRYLTGKAPAAEKKSPPPDSLRELLRALETAAGRLRALSPRVPGAASGVLLETGKALEEVFRGLVGEMRVGN